ncbi:MAG: hypothetical protein KC503_32445 [Myxococcales bacterium]|nr:hypothetical protein [Myxococcales bacterium]
MRNTTLVFIAMTVWASGCGGDPAPEMGKSDPSTVRRDDSSPHALPTGRVNLPTRYAERCDVRTPLGGGRHERTIVVRPGGRLSVERRYDVYIPRWLPRGESVPLVFYLHPLLTDRLYLQRVGVQALADREGFIAVFPQGLGKSWNGGACCGPANGVGSDAPAVDDVGFIRAVLADVQAVACVDRRRVYATGFSNGGFLAHRLGCEASDLFAAIAPVAAVNGMPPERCNPRHPVAVLAINGTADQLAPFDGGFSFEGITRGAFISAERSTQMWAKLDGCRSATSSASDNSGLSCTIYDQCAGGVQVTLCAIRGAGHCWYGEPSCVFGPNSRIVDATEETWAFLKQYRRR